MQLKLKARDQYRSTSLDILCYLEILIVLITC